VVNVLGTGLPLLAALFAVPALIGGMGTPRFGVLTLAWAVAGYVSLFDLGLGRAMTQVVAEKLGSGDEEKIPSLVWNTMVFMVGLGVAAGLAVGIASPWLVTDVLEVPSELRSETIAAFRLLAASMPIVISTNGLRGILEAYQRFAHVNAVRVPLGVVNYLGPLLILPYSNTLPSVVGLLVVARCASWLVYLGLCVHLHPSLAQRQRLEMHALRGLFSFGGWITVSNVVGPLLLYLGRLLIAALISVEAVAYFATPYDVVVNILVIPGAFVAVLFPAFSELFTSNPASVVTLYRRSAAYIGIILLPIVVLVYVFAEPGLAWWINEEFSANGFRVARWLAIGVYINAFGHLAQTVIQSYGRPDVTAKLHLAELIAYVPYLWWLIGSFGIDGAAIAWVIRVAASTLALGFLAHACLEGSLARGTR